MKFPERFREIDRQRIVKAAKTSLRSLEEKKILDYLKNERRLSDEVIEKFDIGYCPTTINHCLSSRIITPIFDHNKELVALSTRHIDKNASFRFWHESFDKGSYLYGLCYAKDAIVKKQKAIVVEGEMDVACLHSFGFDVTVGVCGSAFTLFQAALLGRYCSDIYFLLDGDKAGEASIKRVTKLYKTYSLHAYGLNFIPVQLPQGYDPDDFVIQRGRKDLIDLLNNAKEEYSFICKGN